MVVKNHYGQGKTVKNRQLKIDLKTMLSCKVV